MITMTYKEFFEKAKYHEQMKNIIMQTFIKAIELSPKAEEVTGKKIDTGIAMLDTLNTLTENFAGVTLINKEEITGEYMAKVLNEYAMYER